LWFPEFQKHYLDTKWWGHSLFEFGVDNGELYVDLLPRKNVRPKTGVVLVQQSDTSGIAYREMREYGSWLIEAGGTGVGLLNRAVPHVLMKRFAQSCWSEFCEIFGMPTRVVKTNTSDPDMLNRATQMMQQWGSNSWGILDETENVEFAETANSTGEVYRSLITLCNSEISLLVSGAILGQDTEHGTRGKEQVSADMLDDLVRADRTDFENYVNATLLPALYKIGYLSAKLTFKFKPLEDLGSLWCKAKEAMPYYNVDKEWVKDKFGIPLEDKTFGGAQLQTLNNKPDFFG
jgi:phage gp29-like protein